MKVFYGLCKSYRVNGFPCGLSKASPFRKVHIFAFPFVVLNIVNSFNKVLILTIYFDWWGRVLDLSRQGIQYRGSRVED